MATMFSDSSIDDEVRAMAHALAEGVRAEAGPLFVLTGAGVSLASGIRPPLAPVNQQPRPGNPPTATQVLPPSTDFRMVH
jgi:hypothetical protein